MFSRAQSADISLRDCAFTLNKTQLGYLLRSCIILNCLPCTYFRYCATSHDFVHWSSLVCSQTYQICMKSHYPGYKISSVIFSVLSSRLWDYINKELFVPLSSNQRLFKPHNRMVVLLTMYHAMVTFTSSVVHLYSIVTLLIYKLFHTLFNR